MELDMFRELKRRVVEAGYGKEIIWQERCYPPFTADEFFGEYLWVVISSGMKNQIARLIETRIYEAWEKGLPTSSAFGHKGKVKAIDQVRDNKASYFERWLSATDKLTYLESLPFIGSTTKYHLAKNLGEDVVKPDRHLVRIATQYGKTPDQLCGDLAIQLECKKAVVDIIIWRAANLGYI